jgi:hypothetical protein
MDEAFAAAEQVPAEERRALAHGFASAKGTREERIKASLMSIALRPQYYGPSRLLLSVQIPRDGKMSINPEENAADRAAAEEFVVELYRSRAGTASEEQLNWLSGLAELLFTAGRWKEALPLQRELVANEGSTYAKVALALMEKLDGNDAPYAAITANCPPAPEGYERPAQYCADVSRSLLKRMTGLAPASQQPPAVAEILSGRAVAGTSMETRMHDLHILMNGNREAARAELNAILATPDVPDWARNDAILMLMNLTAQGGNPNELMMHVDCYLSRRGATVQTMTAAQWQELLMLEPPSEETRFIQSDFNDCMQHHGKNREPIDTDLGCLAHVLQFRHMAALNLRADDRMRQTNEWMAALVLKSGRGLLNLTRMLTIGSLNVRSEGARQQVQQYVAQLPAGDWFTAERSEPAVRQQTKRVSEPWPAEAPKGLTCRTE